MSVVMQLYCPVKAIENDECKRSDLCLYPYKFGRSRKHKRTVAKLEKMFPDSVYFCEDSNYLACIELAYSQGWFCKKRFYKLDNTSFYATDKESVRKLIMKWVKCKYWVEFTKRFVDNFEDGMIFELAW